MRDRLADSKIPALVLVSGNVDNQAFKTPVPLYEWEGSKAWNVASNRDAATWSGDAARLLNLEIHYHSGDFAKAIQISGEIIDAAEGELSVMSAMATRMMAHVALGNADTAYADLADLVHRCQEGLHRADDWVVYTTSLLCARRIETALMIKTFDYPYIEEDGVDRLPGGVKALLGTLLAIRELQRGNVGKAEGIVYAFQRVIGSHYPASRVALMLLAAGIDIANGRTEHGEARFRSAWDIAGKTGLVMPFVELNSMLYGLPRHCFPDRRDAEHRRVASISRTYYKGWCDLRAKCGARVLGETLTPLEWYVVTLGAKKWRNKEIATFLNISENTVKHQLTSCYQKIGVPNRSGLADFVAAAYAIAPVSF